MVPAATAKKELVNYIALGSIPPLSLSPSFSPPLSLPLIFMRIVKNGRESLSKWMEREGERELHDHVGKQAH